MTSEEWDLLVKQSHQYWRDDRGANFLMETVYSLNEHGLTYQDVEWVGKQYIERPEKMFMFLGMSLWRLPERYFTIAALEAGK